MAVYKSIYICYAQSTDSDHPRILQRKPRTELLRNNPRIAHVNLGSARNLLGSSNQTSAIRVNTQPNLGHLRQQTHDRSRTQSSSAIRVNEATIDRTRKAVRSSAAKKPRSIAHAKQLGHPLQRTHVAADGRAVLRARSIVGLLTRMAEVWLRDPR